MKHIYNIIFLLIYTILLGTAVVSDTVSGWDLNVVVLIATGILWIKEEVRNKD